MGGEEVCSTLAPQGFFFFFFFLRSSQISSHKIPSIILMGQVETDEMEAETEN